MYPTKENPRNDCYLIYMTVMIISTRKGNSVHDVTRIGRSQSARMREVACATKIRKIQGGYQGVLPRRIPGLNGVLRPIHQGQGTTMFSRKHLPWPADAWRARENTRRVLNGTAEEKKLGKWQCNYDASNFDVAIPSAIPARFYEQMLSALVSARPPLFQFIIVAPLASRILLETHIISGIVNDSHYYTRVEKKVQVETRN